MLHKKYSFSYYYYRFPIMRNSSELSNIACSSVFPPTFYRLYYHKIYHLFAQELLHTHSKSVKVSRKSQSR